jgi:hypothetical protein
MKKSSRSKTGQRGAPVTRVQSRTTNRAARPAARWVRAEGRRLVVIENATCRVTLWPELGGAITGYEDRASGLDIIWHNPWVETPRAHVIDQPLRSGSDLFDVMDGSWYVSLPNGFFAGDFFGAPLGTHGELRAVPWVVTELHASAHEARVTLVGRSVRTPLVYRRTLTLARDTALLRWDESLENRSREPLPVAWLHHPTFGGPLIEGAQLITPARTVRVFQADDPNTLQLRAGYSGEWPNVPERVGGAMRDCSIVVPADSGRDHSVQLTDFMAGWGCVWNERRSLGFAMEWDLNVFPYAWSWNCGGGHRQYPLWGEGHLITLQPSTSPVGRWPDLLRDGAVLTVPARGSVTTTLRTGFVTTPRGPWAVKTHT